MTNLNKCIDNEITKCIDDCIDKGNNIISELAEQDQKIDKINSNLNEIDDNITWSQYIITIISSYFSFLWISPPKFFYKKKDTRNNLLGYSESDDEIKEIDPLDDNDILEKVKKVKNIALTIGIELDDQNLKLNTNNEKIDNTSIKLEKQTDKINKLIK